MKRFKFELEPLLRVRKMEENLALAGLARIMTQVNEAEAAKDEAKKQISSEMNLFARKKTVNLTIEDYKIYNRYLERLDAKILQSDNRLEAMRPDREREQGKVVDARRKRRVVEILKERKKEEYDYDRKKSEIKELDEIRLMSDAGKKPIIHSGAEAWRSSKKIFEADLYEMDDEFESADSEFTEFDKTEKKDAVSEYFKKYGMDDPRKTK